MNLKLSLLATTLFAGVLTVTGCNATTKTITESSTVEQKAAYTIGYMMASNNKADLGKELDLDTFEAGFRDAFADKDSALTDEQMKEALVEFQKVRETQIAEEMKTMATTNKEAGAAFLTENKAKEGVKTTESGLQYKVITEGTGASPKATDIVKVDYEGKLLDGKVFDSSYERGQPVEFPLNQVIPGWTEGVQLMNKGAKYEFYIPGDLAYGEAGAPGIEPNSTLIFTVELLDFKAP